MKDFPKIKKSAFAPVCTRQAACEPEAKVSDPPLSLEGSDRDLEDVALYSSRL